VHHAVFTHITGKYVLHEGIGGVLLIRWVTGTSYGIIAPLVSGVTSIIDEAEFDAMRWYSILEEQK
jgi:acetyl-CoA synthetase